MAADNDMAFLVDSCCSYCCQAADLGTHDYCVECDHSPYCPKPYEDDDKKDKKKKKKSTKGGKDK